MEKLGDEDWMQCIEERLEQMERMLVDMMVGLMWDKLKEEMKQMMMLQAKVDMWNKNEGEYKIK
jgi:hypothetical protein